MPGKRVAQRRKARKWFWGGGKETGLANGMTAGVSGSWR